MTTTAASPHPALMSERRVTYLGALLTTLGPISMAIYTPKAVVGSLFLIVRDDAGKDASAAIVQK